MKVRWTSTALEHLVAIYEYIARDSPHYARRTADRITRRSEQIGFAPLSGRRVPEYEADDVREVIEAPYRIIYRICERRIDVLAIVHAARQLPPEI